MSSWVASRAGAAQQFLRGKPTSRLKQICYCRPPPRTSQRSVIRLVIATATPPPIRRFRPKVTIQLSIFGVLLESRHRRPRLLLLRNRICGSKTGRRDRRARRCANDRRLSFACVHHYLAPPVCALFFN